MQLPASFLLGTATAATQIEGSCDTSDWADFARIPGRIRNGDTPAVACDHWNRFREDVALQRELGMTAHRMSIEWARLEPTAGAWDDAAWARYREELGALRDAGITPMITLHHFTLPSWLARRGGVLHPAFPSMFVRFAREAMARLGDLCADWITINEPNVYVAFGYVVGVWPPARTSLPAAYRAYHRLLAAHHAAYRAMHEVNADVRVGLAHHLRVIEPERDRLDHRLLARAYRALFNDAFADAVNAAGTQDFFGVNYYGRDLVRPSTDAREGFLHRGVPEGAAVSDLGWEIFPEGLGRVLDEWAPKCRVPIWITENGIADADDSRRPAFLVAHLREIARAIERGVDVRGYLHWTLTDNFEWAEGYHARFGLVHVDWATQRRTIRPSGSLYAEIARTLTLPDASSRAG